MNADIELNPVRADMVKSPGAYRWSGYQANAQGKDSEIINYNLKRALTSYSL